MLPRPLTPSIASPLASPLSGDALPWEMQGGGAAESGGEPVENETPAVLAGTPTVGGTSTISAGTWSGSPTLTYTLQRDGVDDDTAVGLTKSEAEAYVYVAADIGPDITWLEIPNGQADEGVPTNAVAYGDSDLDTDWGGGILLDERDQSGSPLDSWGNQGSGADFTATTTARPSIGRTINGFSAPEADGSNDFMDTTSTFAQVASASAYEFAAVIHVDAINTDFAPASGFQNDVVLAHVSQFWWAGFRNNSGTLTFQLGHWDGAGKTISAGGMATGADVLVWGYFDGSNIRGGVRGQSDATPVSAGNVSTTTGVMRIFRTGAGAAFYDGIAAWIGLRGTALTANKRATVHAYLAWKYDL